MTVANSTSPTVTTAIADQTIEEGDQFSLDATTAFDDADGDTLTYTVSPSGSSTEIPDWLTFSDGVFSGTAPVGSIGTTEISVTATDPDGNSVSDSFQLTVNQNVNAAPQAASEQVYRVDPNAAAGTEVGRVVATDFDGDSLSYSIVGGNAGDQFTIDSSTGALTVNDSSGLLAGTVETLNVQASDGTASIDITATVVVSSESLAVRYSLQAFDTDGNAITSVSPGQDIELRLFVQDVRDAARGAFSAFADIAFGVTSVSPTGDDPIMHSATYGAGTSGNLDTAGLVDELGGTDGITDLGGEALEVARVRFTVSNDANGIIHFALNVAEDTIQHPTTLFGEGTAVEVERIDFGSLTLDVDGNG